MNTPTSLTKSLLGIPCHLSLAIVLLIYLFIVRSLRYRRCRQIQSQFETPERPLSSMTSAEAYEIMRQLQELEFPYNFHNALSFGLLKTAGIPTISKLLVATGQLGEKNAPKRAADTEVLLAEVQYSDPASTRHLQAIARMNYLHDRYRKAGKILDKDMLHTLASGIVETFRFIDKFEWRKLTNVEKCAVGIFHKGLGEAMEIPFTPLPSSVAGWRDGLHFALELEEWCYSYEKAVSEPTPSNRILAKRILSIATACTPAFLKQVMQSAIAATMDDHMRVSMGLEAPNRMLVLVLHVMRTVRKFILLHFSLPRPNSLAVKVIADNPNPLTGMYNMNKYAVHPWYVKPSFWQRWGLKAWLVKAFGSGIVPGDMGDMYDPQGYDIRKIGPTAQKGKGMSEMSSIIESLKAKDRSSCPFAIGK